MRKNNLLKLALLPVLALALVVGACSDDPMQTSLTQPNQAAFSRGGNTKVSAVRLSNPAPLSVSAEVGSSGALLQAEHYFLLVPRGAVRKPTTFTMDVAENGVVSLNAYETRANGTRVDVGVVGFRKPVTVALYYGSSAEAEARAANLQVAWLQSNGALVTVPSLVSAEYKVVYGQLNHFSQYALAEPRDDDGGW